MPKGGFRPGAGRKPNPDKPKYMSIRLQCTREQKEQLQELATLSGLTLTQYLIQSGLHQLEPPKN